mgnify:FL=1
MRAAVIEGPDTLAVRNVPDPNPVDGEVVVEVAGCGICGTDVHLVDGSLPGTPYPLIPGHEFYGLAPYDVYRREITIVGSMAVLDSFDRAITALADRPQVAAALVSHRIPLGDYPTALEVFRSGRSGKVEIVPTA